MDFSGAEVGACRTVIASRGKVGAFANFAVAKQSSGR
jgi:hypothetical protein